MITLKKYTVLFSIKPAVRLEPKLGTIELNFEEKEYPKKVVISRIEEKISGSKIQSGLQLRVFVFAKNIEGAIKEAKSFADGIASAITLASGVGLDVPSESVAYEITPNVSERDFVQVFYDPFRITVSRRTLNHDLLIQILDHFMKSESDITERIGRSIRWYRMGAFTPDVFDRFNCFWIGLEALNPILQKMFNVKDDKTRCPKCEYEWVSTPTVSGIRLFVQKKVPEGKKLYKRFRELRINLMHCKERFERLHAEATELTPKIGEVLFRAICYILEIEQWETATYNGLLLKVPIRLELEAMLINGETEALGPDGKDPFFELTYVAAPKVSNDGMTFTGKPEFTARLNPKVKWRPREVRFYGDPEVKGSIINSEVRKKG